jgi:hypothetical protein
MSDLNLQKRCLPGFEVIPRIVTKPPFASCVSQLESTRARDKVEFKTRMDCSICHRQHEAKKLPFLCAVDARNRLYEGRVEIAQALIQCEEAERQAGQVADAHVASICEEQAARDRTNQIIAQADRLRAEIESARKDIHAKKEAITRKRSDLTSVSSGSLVRRSRQLDEMERSSQRIKFMWNRSAETMAATRAFLCEEAARLYGLRQVKKGNTKRYEIGGVEIFDLHAMNSESWLP